MSSLPLLFQIPTPMSTLLLLPYNLRFPLLPLQNSSHSSTQSCSKALPYSAISSSLSCSQSDCTSRFFSSDSTQSSPSSCHMTFSFPHLHSSVPSNLSAFNLNSAPTRSLKILSLNVRSLLPKFDEFCLVCAFLSPNIICVSESWLSQDILDHEIALINYQLFRKDRNRHGGGVLLHILFAVPLKLSCDLELLLVSVKVFNQTFTLGSYYRPPSSLNGISDLVELLSSVPSESIQNLIIAGDFNVDMSSPSGRLFSDFSSLLNSFPR